eukprot:10908171-Lingulodinium_polyedra.AAC.1
MATREYGTSACRFRASIAGCELAAVGVVRGLPHEARVAVDCCLLSVPAVVGVVRGLAREAHVAVDCCLLSFLACRAAGQ